MKFRILVEYKNGSGMSWWEELNKFQRRIYKNEIIR